MDRIELRPQQSAIAERLLLRAQRGEKRPLLGYLAPGFGKEYAWQHAATVLARAKLIDAVAAFGPRINLAKQAEVNWGGIDRDGNVITGWSRRYEPPVPLFAWAQGNTPPLVKPGMFGYISTYASLVRQPGLHEDLIRRHGGRVLLVADEAAYLGSSRVGSDEIDFDDRDGTKAADAVRRLMDLSALAPLLLSGAPNRYDGQRLVGIEDRYEQRPGGLWVLTPDAEDVVGTYTEGVAARFLRRFHVTYADAQGTLHLGDLETSTTPRDGLVSLSEFLQAEEVWQPMVAACLKSLRAIRRQTGVPYCAAVACSNTEHARVVERFAKQRWPGAVRVAVSKDGKAAQDALDATRRGDVDVLIFVKQVFIGFDHKPLNHLVLLTPGRDDSYLRQTVMRAGRVLDGDETAYVWTLDDPRAHAFFERLKADGELGMRERQDGETPDGPGDRRELTDPQFLGFGYDSDDDALADQVLSSVGVRVSGEEAERLRRFFAGGSEPQTPTPDVPTAVLTQEERTDEITQQTSLLVTRETRRRCAGGGNGGQRPDAGAIKRAIQKEISQASAVWKGDRKKLTPTEAQRRHDAAVRLFG